MTTFYYQPQASEVGTLPSIFSVLGSGSPWPTLRVVDAGDGTYVLRSVGSTYGPTISAALSGAGTPGVFANGEIYVKLKMGDYAILSAQIRNGGTASSSAAATYYSAALDGRGSGNIRLKNTALQANAFIRDTEILTKGSAVGVFLHLMVKASGTTISLKMWKDGESEPSYSTYTDSKLTSGYAALMTGNGTSDIYFVGVGTGADAAPRSASGGNAAPTFPGPNIADIIGTESVALTPVDVSSLFFDSESGLTFSAIGSWPAGVTVSSTGVISGTPTTAGTYASLQVRATDAGSLAADSNSFTITVVAPGDAENPTLTGPVTFASITQTSYTAQWPAGSDNVGVTGYEYQIGSTAGAWTDAGNSLSAAITGRTAGVTETVYVRAYDAAGLRSTPAISGSVTLESIPAAGINVTDPLKNNTGTVLASQSGVRVAVLQAADLVSVYESTGLTTNASGTLATISDAAITAGQQYHVAIKLADGSVGITGPITAS